VTLESGLSDGGELSVLMPGTARHDSLYRVLPFTIFSELTLLSIDTSCPLRVPAERYNRVINTHVTYCHLSFFAGASHGISSPGS